jgi:hypothetical protein
VIIAPLRIRAGDQHAIRIRAGDQHAIRIRAGDQHAIRIRAGCRQQLISSCQAERQVKPKTKTPGSLYLQRFPGAPSFSQARQLSTLFNININVSPISPSPEPLPRWRFRRLWLNSSPSFSTISTQNSQTGEK